MQRTRFALRVLGAVATLSLWAATSYAIWPSSGGGTLADEVHGVARDSVGNVYVVGEFRGTAVFGSETLSSEGLSDIFVAKYAPDGTVVWAASGGGPSVDRGLAIAVDPGQHVYITGSFAGSATFEQPFGLPITLPQGSTTPDQYGDIFVARLSIDGEWDWVRQAGRNGVLEEGRDIVFLPGDAGVSPPAPESVVIAARGACPTFRKDDGTSATLLSNTAVCGGGNTDSSVLVAALDVAGDWRWALGGGSTATNEWATELATDGDGNLFLGGIFFSDVTIGSTALDATSPGGGGSGQVLEFDHAHNGGGFEGGVLEYSVNGGASWADILAGSGSIPANSGRFLANGYQSTISGGDNPYTGRLGWTYTFGARTTRVDLSDFQGSSIRFRWIYSSGAEASPSEPGWRIDNQRIGTATETYFSEDWSDFWHIYNWWNAYTGIGGGYWHVSAACFTNEPVVGDADTVHVLDSTERGYAVLYMTRDVVLPIAGGNYFVARVNDPTSTAPSWGWVEKIPDTVTLEDLEVDDLQNLYLAGTSIGSAAFGSLPAVSTAGALVVKVDGSDPAVLAASDWVYATGVAGGEASGLEVDSTTGDVYLTGSYDAALSFGGHALPAPGGSDVFVAKLAASGSTWDWATWAGDAPSVPPSPSDPAPFDDHGVDLVFMPPEDLYVVGDFKGTGIFGDQRMSSSLDSADVFVAQMTDNLTSGDWFTVQIARYAAGEWIQPPPDACLTNDLHSRPEIVIDAPGLAIPDYFFWSPPGVYGPEGRLFALQPIIAEIKWKETPAGGCENYDPLVDTGRIIDLVQVDWPDEVCPPSSAGTPCRQIHVAGVPVEVEPPGLSITFAQKVDILGGSGSPDASVDSKIFQARQAGYSMLIYTDDPNDPNILSQRLLFEVVQTVQYSSAPRFGAKTWDVGLEITDGDHQDRPGRNGYVLFQRAYYDGAGADAAYDREARSGPIIPVNAVNPLTSDGQDLMVVVWGRTNGKGVSWPEKPVRYDVDWPADPDKIIIASEQGSENLGQAVLDPAVFPSMRIYQQPDSSLPGFNPNDEHALFAPSNTGSGFDAVYAIRADFGLGDSHTAASEPYVLLKYWDEGEDTWRFKIYHVMATGAGFSEFRYPGTAGTKVFPPYPLRLLQGCPQTTGAGDPFFLDYQNSVWARSAGTVRVRYWYPLQEGFHYDINGDGQVDATSGQCVPWNDRLPGGTPGVPIPVDYEIAWPAEVPTLLVGETLLRQKRGLPNIFNQAAAEIVYDELDPDVEDPFISLAQLIDPLSPRKVSLAALPSDLATELDAGKKRIVGNSSGTIKLPFAVRTRLLYDELNHLLSFEGYLNEDGVGEPLLLLNVMTERERDLLLSLSTSTAWVDAVFELYALTRNPQQLDLPGAADDDLLIGLDVDDQGNPIPLQVLGLSPALTAGNAAGTGYLTLAFNNDPTLNPLPVSLNVIRVDCLEIPPEDPEIISPYQGEIKVIKSDNVFDEQLTLRHSGDFGGNSDNLEFRWYFHPDVDGSPPTPLPDPDTGQLNGWLEFQTPDPVGAVDITIQGANIQTLSDNWFVVRYKGLPGCTNLSKYSIWAGQPGSTPTEIRAQLAEGWIKRVLGGLNPFETRVKDFHAAPTNNYASMLVLLGTRYEGDIAFNGSPDNLNSIGLIEAYETVLRRGMSLSIGGTPPVNYPPANAALLLVASRISDFYVLLGNEAYADAQDPMIGYGTDSGIYGSLAPTIFSFQNQLDSLLEEELVLLRGRDNSRGPIAARPIYNRLFPNFTTGDGEFAYALAYNITDQNVDGVIDETDARILFPQGHGDAWGHYLTAMTTYYKLLRHPFYTWEPRSEAVLVAGTAIQVDFQDERKFAKAAAAKAKAGEEIVDLTYRSAYVEDPEGQWQGYKDTNPDRAWGLSEWARRAGQGALFDWVVGNSLLPAVDPNPQHVGIQKIDRTTVTELHEISSHANGIQQQLDEADRGLNPLGLAKGVVPFDINPGLIDHPTLGKTHFEQIFDRAVAAMDNAVAVFNHANKLTELLRRNQDTTDDLWGSAMGQERDFRNRLIEIYGYPYEDDIGPGGTYPAGYDGPDIYHYMYIDQSDLTGTPDAPVQIVTAEFAPLGGGVGFYNFSTPLASVLQPLPSVTLPVTYHIADTADFAGIIKPPEWTGTRRAPGELQDRLSDILVALNNYEQSLTSYDNLIKDIEDATTLLQAQYAVNLEEVIIKNTEKGVVLGLNAVIAGLKATQIGLKRGAEIARFSFKDSAKCVPRNMIAGVAAGGDMGAPAVCALDLAGNTTGLVLDTVADGLAIAELVPELAKDVVGLTTSITLDILTSNLNVAQQIKSLEQLMRQEPVARLAVYQQREIVEQQRGNYLEALAKGQRLLEELVAFRTNTAGDVQTYRYQDMTFRVFRNDALQKYRAQFDLTARYVYLAATAYDYETNLLGSSAQAGQTFLTDIVRERSLGQLLDGSPVPGSRGLADPMGRMSQNFAVLKTQLGFNNPQTETNRFSLRRELFRLHDDSDEEWQTVLEQSRVDNLWDLPEFRRYCRPFAPELLGPQPGLVIPFDTTVTFGLNFFGWPLGGGDSAYDPTNFATKVRSVGVWFSNYDNTGLSETPRVYLVPVGADVLRSPSADDFTTRQWKVIDQVLSVPFPIGGTDLDDPTWIPQNDTLSDPIDSSAFGDIRRFSSFRAYHDSGVFNPDETISESRLIGRSVWNTKWLLIIPGGTLLSDPDTGLDTLIYGQLVPGGDEGERDGNGINDIKLFFQTYAYSGN